MRKFFRTHLAESGGVIKANFAPTEALLADIQLHYNREVQPVLMLEEFFDTSRYTFFDSNCWLRHQTFLTGDRKGEDEWVFKEDCVYDPSTRAHLYKEIHGRENVTNAVTAKLKVSLVIKAYPPYNCCFSNKASLKHSAHEPLHHFSRNVIALPRNVRWTGASTTSMAPKSIALSPRASPQNLPSIVSTRISGFQPPQRYHISSYM